MYLKFLSWNDYSKASDGLFWFNGDFFRLNSQPSISGWRTLGLKRNIAKSHIFRIYKIVSEWRPIITVCFLYFCLFAVLLFTRRISTYKKYIAWLKYRVLANKQCTAYGDPILFAHSLRSLNKQKNQKWNNYRLRNKFKMRIRLRLSEKKWTTEK